MTELEYLKKYLPPEKNLEEAIQRLESGEPVQYIIGETYFYNSPIKVNKDVLIPRPETEELMEKVAKLIKEYLPSNLSILDIGTGSGCIPIALKKEFKDANITACDISSKALDVAKSNAKLNNVNINFQESDIFSNIDGTFDLIISNPPYIREDEEIMPIVKNNEPHLALYAKDNGLYFYKEIIKKSFDYLKPKSIIAFEIGEKQGNDIINIAKEYFSNAKIILEQDFHHLDRYIFIINE